MKIIITLSSLALLFILLCVLWIFSFDFFPLKKKTNNEAYSSYIAKSLPLKVTEAGGSACNGKFYFVGGIGAFTQSFSEFYCYSPNTDEWEEKDSFPCKINHPGIVAYNDKIYVAGGFAPIGLRIRGFMFADWKPKATLYIYNTTTNKWHLGAELPAPRGAGDVCAKDGFIYYCGGIDENKKITNKFFRYNIEANSWETLPPMPTPRDHLRIESVGDFIYAISGRKDDLRFNLDNVEAYNILTEEWSARSPIPFARGGFGSCVYNNKIYTFGGEFTWKSLKNIEEYDPSTDSWKTLPDMPEPRHGICADVINNKIHLVSGGLRPRISVSNVHRVIEIK